MELLGDLCFIETLYQTGLLDEKSEIIFHCKLFPWFVSDTIQNDLKWMLNFFATEFESKIIKDMSKRWSRFLENKNWQLKSHLFWQTPFEYSSMNKLAPDLYKELSESDLVILKGDLNYRKAINDFILDPYKSFEDALGDFKPTNLLSIR